MMSGDRDVTYFNRTLIIILHLICLLTKLAGAHLTPQQIFNVKQGGVGEASIERNSDTNRNTK